MNKKLLFRSLIFVALSLSACAQAVAPTVTPATENIQDLVEVTPPTSSAPLIEDTPASDAVILPFEYNILELDMLDANHGAALLLDQNNSQILAITENSGEQWNTITPTGVINIASFDLTEDGTLYLVSNNIDGSGTLWRAKDNGESWSETPLFADMIGSDLKFNDNGYGLATIQDAGAGNRYVHYYESSDFGDNWSLLPLLPASPEDGLPEGVIQLCGICGDLIEQTETNSLILYGELANEPVEWIRLSVSADRGNHWNEIKIAKPAELMTSTVMPVASSISGEVWSVLVALLPSDPAAMAELFTITSSDKGANWNLTDLSIATLTQNLQNVEFYDTNLAAILCGLEICFIDTIKSTVDRVFFDNQAIVGDLVDPSFRFHFIDQQTGWLIISTQTDNILIKTINRGEDWERISQSLTQADQN